MKVKRFIVAQAREKNEFTNSNLLHAEVRVRVEIHG
jgi:hypothetical protein